MLEGHQGHGIRSVLAWVRCRQEIAQGEDTCERWTPTAVRGGARERCIMPWHVRQEFLPEVTLLMRISKNWFTDAVNIYALLMTSGCGVAGATAQSQGRGILRVELWGSVSWERSLFEGLDVLERHWGQMLMWQTFTSNVWGITFRENNVVNDTSERNTNEHERGKWEECVGGKSGG